MLPVVHEWVAEAGAIALRMRTGVDVQIKADRTPVTAADNAIETLLRRHIKAAYPEHNIVGEEEGASRRSSPFVWAIDPIDGTSNYARGLPVWGVSVGLLHDGIPVLGCFYMPELKEWYEADLTGPALFNGHPITVQTHSDDDPEAWICVPSNVHRRYVVHYRGKLRVLGCLAAYVAYVARGVTVGALLGYPHIWDIAGSLAVLHRAGGTLRYLGSDSAVDLTPMLAGSSPRHPLLAGSPTALVALQSAITLR
ncbi:MAG: inositol monophosphatase family protein [Herpetosiphon sp.]